MAWTLADGSERGGYLDPGITFHLLDFWSSGWIIEAKH